jgi:hypothetical protein
MKVAIFGSLPQGILQGLPTEYCGFRGLPLIAGILDSVPSACRSGCIFLVILQGLSCKHFLKALGFLLWALLDWLAFPALSLLGFPCCFIALASKFCTESFTSHESPCRS